VISVHSLSGRARTLNHVHTCVGRVKPLLASRESRYRPLHLHLLSGATKSSLIIMHPSLSIQTATGLRFRGNGRGAATRTSQVAPFCLSTEKRISPSCLRTASRSDPSGHQRTTATCRCSSHRPKSFLLKQKQWTWKCCWSLPQSSDSPRTACVASP
jgi:hypothetical protein